MALPFATYEPTRWWEEMNGGESEEDSRTSISAQSELEQAS